MSVLDQISDMPDMEKIAAARVDWKVATQEGNKLCNKIHKMMKNIKETDTFKTEIILVLNEFLDTVFDIINNKVPGLGDFLELKGLEQIHRPDWGRAFLTIDELRHEIYNRNYQENATKIIHNNKNNIIYLYKTTDQTSRYDQ